MKVVLAAGLVLAAAIGCYSYPSASDTYHDQIVATRYDSGANFGEFTTFTVAPSVSYIDSANFTGVADELPADVAGPLIDEVTRQLTARGYQQVMPEDGPELGAKITVIKGTVEGVDYVSYWGGYGYYSPYYWGYYYPYAVPVYYEYDTTVTRVDLVDVRTARPAELAAAAEGTPPNDLPALWTAVIYGLLEATTAQEAQQAATAIDQAFKQSPYIKRP